MRDILLQVNSHPEPAPEWAVHQTANLAEALKAKLSLGVCQVHIPQASNWLANTLLKIDRIIADENRKSAANADALADIFATVVAPELRGDTFVIDCPATISHWRFAVRARTYDLTVIPIYGHAQTAYFAEGVVFDTGRPMLLLPKLQTPELGFARIAVAWDGSRVAARAVADAMLADELFGHERDAFPGALQTRKGKMEMAEGGTLFLDEIGNLDLKLQGELLSAMEAEQITRLGGADPVRTGYRLICASGMDLEQAVKDGRFRQDLYYRLTVFEIALPPLRARRGDIAKLAHFFLVKYARAMNRKMHGFSPDAMLALKAYDWPGNVRELENVIERAMVISPGNMINRDHLILHTDLPSPSEGKRLEDVEKRHIDQILRETGWNVSRSATILDIDRVTLYHKIERYNLKREA